MNRKPFWLLLTLVLIFSFVLAACGPTETEAPAMEEEEPAVEEPMEEPEEEPMEEPTEAPMEEPTEEPMEEMSERARTVILDIDGGRVADPELWNPYVPGVRRDQGFHQVMIEPLFILNYQTGEIEPWLGTEMTSNDTFDVWTLTLREGVEWSDGEAFNADDVVFSVNTLMENVELNDGASLQDQVSSVEKIDDLTVQFNLTRPNPFFQLNNWSVRIWGGPNIVPEHIWADKDPLTFTNYDPEQGWPVFTGPYTLDSVSPTEFVFVRNDDWWGAKTGWMELPAPEIAIWTWAGPEETRAALMAEGQLDSLMDITLGALLALQEANPNVITWFDEMPMAWVPDPCSRTFYFNHTVEPWDDPEMRWAVNYAMDREQIVEIAYEGTTLPSRHFFPAYPPLDAMVDKAIEAGAWDLDQLWTYDPELTKEIFESKGYVMNESTGYYEMDGEELGMDISTHEAFIEKQRIAQVLVEQFQAVGINAVQRNEAGGTWNDNREFGNFETQMNWEMCGSVNEPWASMDQIAYKWYMPVGERANRNEARWSGEKAEAYDAIVEEMGTLPLGDPRVEELFIEASRIFFEELPIIPVTQAKKIIPFDTTYWTGWPTFEDDYIHPPTWWQHTHVIIHNLEPTGAQ
jgi:peptide/nickel transport system substrate-binding protein